MIWSASFPERPVRQWVLSVPYQLRYLFATEPQVITKVLAIVHRAIGTWLIKRAGLTVKSGAQTGAVTLIQRFGSPLNLNPHFHLLYVDGVFDRRGQFYPMKAPTPSDLDSLTHQIAQRVSRYLEQAGYLVRDAESAYLDLQTDEDDAIRRRPRRTSSAPPLAIGSPLAPMREERHSHCRRCPAATVKTSGRW